MQELIVLGLVPGTSIQITFYMWLWVVCLIVSSIIAGQMRKHHTLEMTLIALIIVLRSRRRLRA